MKITYIYITENAKRLAEEICYKKLKNETLNGEVLHGEIITYKSFKENKKSIFKSSDFLVFIMATGIVVRSIAGLLESKFTDPGVVVMDEAGKNVISLLSGHIGGANELTMLISEKIGANPVITTATDVNNKGAFDMILKLTDAKIENMRNMCLDINSRILKNEDIYIFIQKEYRNLLKNTINGFIIIDEFDTFKKMYADSKLGNSQERYIIITDRADYAAEISEIYSEKIQSGLMTDMQDEMIFRAQNAIVSDIKGLFMQSEGESGLLERIKEKLVIAVPRKIVLGAGCRKNTDAELFEKTVLSYLEENNISIKSVKKIGSINVKKEEKCILEFADKYGIETEFFTPEKLSEVENLYEKSDFVKKTVGVYSVAEPSCHVMCEGNLIGKKYKSNGITISIGRKK